MAIDSGIFIGVLFLLMIGIFIYLTESGRVSKAPTGQRRALRFGTGIWWLFSSRDRIVTILFMSIILVAIVYASMQLGLVN